MAGSTSIAAKRALMELIPTKAGLEELEVFYAYPGESQAGRAACWFGKTSADTGFTHIQAGRKRRQEDYILELNIQVIGEGNEQDETDDEAFAYLTAIDELIADDPSIGMTQGVASDDTPRILYSEIDGWEQTIGIIENVGTACLIEIRIAVSAQ